MCGIVGIFGKTNQSVIKSMMDVISYRGPDDSGLYFEDDVVALRHRRLSIIDIQGGKQPFNIEEYHLVYNGEIYNHLDLKKELENLGHVFSTKSDTEVLLRCFIQYGYDCVNKLNGIFAFAIWNSKLKELFLARDRFGVCPLYYAKTNSNIYFASETKSLLKVPEISRELNYSAINEYLTFRYVRSNTTFFKDIEKFPPAHYLLYRNGNLTLKRYWELDDGEATGTLTFNDAKDRYRELLHDAVRIRALASDVPVGAYLSSGIDSTAITCLMSEHSRVKTFSIGFNSEVDELKYIKETVNKLGSEHHEIYLQKQDWQLLPKIAYHLDEPVGDSIILPTYVLSSFASKNVKVVLTGDGADEILGGYVHHQSLYRLVKLLNIFSPNIFKSLGLLVQYTPSQILNMLFPYPAKLSDSGKERALMLLSSFPNEIKMYLNFASLFTNDEKELLYGPSLKELNFSETILEGNNLKNQIEKDTLFRRVVSTDIKTWLPNQILHKSDRLLLANSLEGRQPFLDYRLAEFAHSLPDEYKVSFGQTKLVLREAVKNIVPPQIALAKKRAFHLPLHGYFFNEYQSLVKDCLLLNKPELVRMGILNEKNLGNYVNSSLEKKDLLTTKKLFALAFLEIWLQNLKRL